MAGLLGSLSGEEPEQLTSVGVPGGLRVIWPPGASITRPAHPVTKLCLSSRSIAPPINPAANAPKFEPEK